MLNPQRMFNKISSLSIVGNCLMICFQQKAKCIADKFNMYIFGPKEQKKKKRLKEDLRNNTRNKFINSINSSNFSNVCRVDNNKFVKLIIKKKKKNEWKYQ